MQKPFDSWSWLILLMGDRNNSEGSDVSTDAGLDVICVDMDAFFASVEVRDDPSLHSEPVIVCGRGRRSVVASCNYEARLYGVSSAMPTEQAKRLCPNGRFLTARFPVYQRASRDLHAILYRFTPLVEGVALDEAYLDVSGAHLLFGSSLQIANDIREAVREEMGLPCSVGVGRSKLIAKLASEEAKPKILDSMIQPGKGVVAVPQLSEWSFLSGLDVSKLPGVGPVTSTKLRSLGVFKVEDLLNVPLSVLSRHLGITMAHRLVDLARGHDLRKVTPTRERKSIGKEITFDRDLQDMIKLRQLLFDLAVQVGDIMQRKGKAARSISIKVRFANFVTLTRSRSEQFPLHSPSAIARLATALFDQVDPVMPVRLVGVSVSGLVSREEQYYQQALALDSASDGIDYQANAPKTDVGCQWTIEHPWEVMRPKRDSWSLDDRLVLAMETVRERFGQQAILSCGLALQSMSSISSGKELDR